MQTNKKQNKAALGGNGFKQADLIELVNDLDIIKNETVDNITNFFSIGGIEWPIELLADSLHALINNRDELMTGVVDGVEQHVPMYMMISHREFDDKVFSYCATMKFFAKLSDQNRRTAFLRQRLRELEINEQ